MATTDLGPSERDIRIYVAHKIEGHSLRRCGKKFKLDPARIWHICRAVQPWVVRQLVADHPDRMTLKLEAHARYERIWQEANRGWRRSLKDAETIKLKGPSTADGEGAVLEAEQTKKGQAGDSQFLRMMHEAEKAIRELWGLDDPKPEQGQGKTPGVFINVNGAESRVDIRSDLLNDGDYLEFQRQRALAVDADSRPVRESGERRPVEDGAAPGGTGPLGGAGGNGQANGHHH